MPGFFNLRNDILCRPIPVHQPSHIGAPGRPIVCQELSSLARMIASAISAMRLPLLIAMLRIRL